MSEPLAEQRTTAELPRPVLHKSVSPRHRILVERRTEMSILHIRLLAKATTHR